MTTGILHGHTASVTGGSRGIGAAIVRSLVQAGAAVAVNYRERANEANTLVEAIGEAGGHAIALAADVSQSDAVAQMVQRVKSDLGPIDILINNAGIAITRDIEDLSENDFDQTIAVNQLPWLSTACHTAQTTSRERKKTRSFRVFQQYPLFLDRES
jgi:3-oxoacyl-[acyl-carrier protein] reductase